MFSPYKVKVFYYSSDGCTELEGFGTEKDDNVFSLTAKRLVEEYSGKEPNRVVSVDVTRIKTEDIPANIKKGWPENIKTVPCYVYEYRV